LAPIPLAIERYALIGDTQSAGLVGDDGSLDGRFGGARLTVVSADDQYYCGHRSGRCPAR
jgi:hypothetical protein